MNAEKPTSLNFEEPLQPYGKSIQQIIKDKDERIDELKALVKLLEEKVGGRGMCFILTYIMKKLILILVLHPSTFFLGICQDIKINEISSQETITLLMSVRGTEFFNPDSIAIKIVELSYLTSNQIPGIKNPDLIEVFRLFVSVSELLPGEKSQSKKFWIEGDFFNPRKYKFDKSTRILSLVHGSTEKPKLIKFLISREGIRTFE